MKNQVKRNCSVCGGTGAADSGGVYEWGETIYLPCECFFERNDKMKVLADASKKMENETIEVLASAIKSVADAICPEGTPYEPPIGGHVASLMESNIYVAERLGYIGDAIKELAEAVRLHGQTDRKQEVEGSS
jgi:hypothetical protein